MRNDADFEAVLEAARAGDDGAWRRIHQSLAGSLLAYARGHGAAEPEDVVGEVFVDLVRGVGRFRGSEDAFRGWAFLIARHRLIDERRRRSRRPDDPTDHLRFEPVAAPLDVATEVVGHMSWERLRTLLDTLTVDQRDVLLLRVVADLSVAETARILGKRAGAVKQLQHRTLKALRNALELREVTE